MHLFRIHPKLLKFVMKLRSQAKFKRKRMLHLLQGKEKDIFLHKTNSRLPREWNLSLFYISRQTIWIYKIDLALIKKIVILL